MEIIQLVDIETERAEKLAVMMKALANPARLAIIKQLSEGSDANCCVDFTQHTSLAQSTVSQHLKVLKDAGLIKLCGDGPRSGWCIDRSAMVWLKQQVVAL